VDSSMVTTLSVITSSTLLSASELTMGNMSLLLNLNMEIARNYFDVLKKLKAEFNLKSPITLKTIADFRDIFTPPAETQLSPGFLSHVEKMFLESLTMLGNMRQEEGLILYQDMDMRLKSIKGILQTINLRAPQVVVEYQKTSF